MVITYEDDDDSDVINKLLEETVADIDVNRSTNSKWGFKYDVTLMVTGLATET